MAWWCLLAAIAVLIAYMRWEAGWLKVERVTASTRLGLRIAVLSDLHLSFCRVPPEKVRAAIAESRSDVFLFLGDAVDKPDQIDKAAFWLQTAANGLPACAVEGNHDHSLFKTRPDLRVCFRESLSDAGIRLLSNEQVSFGREPGLSGKAADHAPLLLIALDDYRHGDMSFPLPPRPAQTTDAPYRLLFTHNPQRIVELPEGYADFAVAGHFHGGQIWMPFGLEFLLFRREALGRAGIRRGLHTVNGIPLYLTRGIGNVLFPLRLGARPELTIIDL